MKPESEEAPCIMLGVAYRESHNRLLEFIATPIAAISFTFLLAVMHIVLSAEVIHVVLHLWA